MTVDEATKPGSPDNDNLPDGFVAKVSKTGRTYYIDHSTKTTSWIHPQGVKFCKSITAGLPYPFERQHDKQGRAYYVDHDARTTSWLNPVKMTELKDMGVLDAEVDELVADGKAGDEWPWIVKETVESGPQKGQAYWVNYRRGPNGVVDNCSPEDTKAGYLATAHARAARENKDGTGRDAKL